MKITHRAPGTAYFTVPESDPVEDAYEAEVQRSTGAGEREHRQAQERLRRAEQRLATTQAEKARAGHRKRIAQLEALVSQRRAEVAELAALMTAAPVAADKQVRLRTGLDDHLELGEYKPQASRRVPPGPVTTTRREGKQ